MSVAQFKVGQAVCRETVGWFKDVPAGQFIVLQVLPEDRWGQPVYRVCGLSDGLERVVLERELRPR